MDRGHPHETMPAMSTPVVTEVKSVLEPVTADTFGIAPLTPVEPSRRRIYD